ncbi:MAG: MarR family transcriptional regulator [Rhodospirillaceae bacterium]|nr:MarR family transcriptional regulator [Rhodospirillaceae bacterium]
MRSPRIIGHEALKAEMQAAARGEKPAPPDAAGMSFNSVESLARLLTPENRSLLATIRDRHPRSIAELGKMTGRAPSNLTRTLDKLVAAGLVRMETENRRKRPVPGVQHIRIEIDPFSTDDRLEYA